MTDLSQVLVVTEQNIQLNCDPERDHVVLEEFDWCQKTLPFSLSTTFDFIVGAELLHYVEVYDTLVATICRLASDNTILFFSYEKRRPQEEIKFFQKLAKHFQIYLVADDYLHPNFRKCNLVIFYGWKRKQCQQCPYYPLISNNELPAEYYNVLLNMT
jgi:hypothetical protein